MYPHGILIRRPTDAQSFFFQLRQSVPPSLHDSAKRSSFCFIEDGTAGLEDRQFIDKGFVDRFQVMNKYPEIVVKKAVDFLMNSSSIVLGTPVH